jgi:hypothetical protein
MTSTKQDRPTRSPNSSHGPETPPPRSAPSARDTTRSPHSAAMLRSGGAIAAVAPCVSLARSRSSRTSKDEQGLSTGGLSQPSCSREEERPPTRSPSAARQSLWRKGATPSSGQARTLMDLAEAFSLLGHPLPGRPKPPRKRSGFTSESRTSREPSKRWRSRAAPDTPRSSGGRRTQRTRACSPKPVPKTRRVHTRPTPSSPFQGFSRIRVEAMASSSSFFTEVLRRIGALGDLQVLSTYLVVSGGRRRAVVKCSALPDRTVDPLLTMEDSRCDWRVPKSGSRSRFPCNFHYSGAAHHLPRRSLVALRIPAAVPKTRPQRRLGRSRRASRARDAGAKRAEVFQRREAKHREDVAPKRRFRASAPGFGS